MILTYTLIWTIFVWIAYGHMSILFPIPRGGLGAETLGGKFDSRVTEWLGYPDSTLGASAHLDRPCLRFSNNTPVSVRAGDTLNFRFYTSKLRSQSPETLNALVTTPQIKPFVQVRHGGGQCHFMLSNDGGVTGVLLAVFETTCPDIYFTWPVKIPANTANCSNCILVWVWFAYNVRQSYVNCIDIRIIGPIGVSLNSSHPAISAAYPIQHPSGDGLPNGQGPILSNRTQPPAAAQPSSGKMRVQMDRIETIVIASCLALVWRIMYQ